MGLEEGIEVVIGDGEAGSVFLDGRILGWKGGIPSGKGVVGEASLAMFLSDQAVVAMKLSVFRRERAQTFFQPGEDVGMGFYGMDGYGGRGGYSRAKDHGTEGEEADVSAEVEDADGGLTGMKCAMERGVVFAFDEDVVVADPIGEVSNFGAEVIPEVPVQSNGFEDLVGFCDVFELKRGGLGRIHRGRGFVWRDIAGH